MHEHKISLSFFLLVGNYIVWILINCFKKNVTAIILWTVNFCLHWTWASPQRSHLEGAGWTQGHMGHQLSFPKLAWALLFLPIIPSAHFAFYHSGRREEESSFIWHLPWLLVKLIFMCLRTIWASSPMNCLVILSLGWLTVSFLALRVLAYCVHSFVGRVFFGSFHLLLATHPYPHSHCCQPMKS